MLVRDIMTEKLSAAFAPSRLEVIDESHRHEGHAGARPGGQTHFRVRIVAEAFRGKSRLDRHRAINQALAAEIEG
ncbi:BolA family transcriptional regulator, partial [Rhodoplanes elegans]